MCGIVGWLQGKSSYSEIDQVSVLREMCDAIRHRGPDDAGYWFGDLADVALGHRRLSILDLSPAGHQPMSSHSGRYVIVFNGEIYNHLDLRKQLQATLTFGSSSVNRRGEFDWRGHSDTETLLAGFELWGVEATLKRATGMFAIALWDRHTGVLTLARDRMGEKPLYYGWLGQGERATFLFASELKALKAHPAFNSSINRRALALLMRHNYISAPHSIYEGISKLEPGCLLQVRRDDPIPRITRFWDFSEVARTGVAQPFSGTPEEAVDALEILVRNSIRQQMLADVPLGAFLSGGIDSSAVVALMQAQSNYPIKTFTIGFNESGYNEAGHAKAVASHLGTDHTELYVTPAQAMAVIPRLPQLYCEPFADSSQIPTFLVSELARKHVTVSLSGDGGDELFCGYTRYDIAEWWWKRISSLPKPMRQSLKLCMSGLGASYLQRLLSTSVGEKFDKGLDMLGSNSLEGVYRSIASNMVDPCDWLIGVDAELPTPVFGSIPNFEGLGPVERMMALDTMSYLPDDILVKVDRAAMGVSLESRVPFLDHRIVEFAWQLPLDYKRRNGMSKWPLRQLLYRYVPRELIDRPKRGFAVPLHDWLRGPLRDWAEALLDSQRLQQEGFFNVIKVRTAWAEHQSGRRNWTPRLWSVLMFQAWLEENNY
jgi:asparagine synthase (glutamine-hydrolysing)